VVRPRRRAVDGVLANRAGALWQYLPDAPRRPLVVRLRYPVGFTIVVLGRQQLFTESTLTTMISLFSHGDEARSWNVARLSVTVFSVNVGGISAAGPRGVRPSESHGSRGGPVTISLCGIFAGRPIALMVWLLPFADTARVTIIMIIT
jgi:formate/nitrite transporter FocA (FNT family)